MMGSRIVLISSELANQPRQLLGGVVYRAVRAPSGGGLAARFVLGAWVFGVGAADGGGPCLRRWVGQPADLGGDD